MKILKINHMIIIIMKIQNLKFIYQAITTNYQVKRNLRLIFKIKVIIKNYNIRNKNYNNNKMIITINYKIKRNLILIFQIKLFFNSCNNKRKNKNCNKNNNKKMII